MIVTQSPAFADDIRRHGFPGDIRVIPYLMPEVSPVVPFPDMGKTIRIGFLGRLAPQKNVGMLPEALVELVRGPQRATEAAYEVHIFGDGTERQRVEKLARRLRVDDAVVFHGPVRHEGVFGAIDSCHLFALPSRTEGQCLAALEILSRGRPLVATPVGALPDIIVDAEVGRLIGRGDVQGLVAAIREIVADICRGVITPHGIRAEYDRRYAHDFVLKQYTALVSGAVGPQGDPHSES
jgi:glycosyltransferase involved in cell wall biosynthesis